MATRSRALEYGRSNNLLYSKNIFEDGWGKIAPDMSVFHAEATRKLSLFNQKHFLDRRANLFDMKAIPQQTELTWKNVVTFADRIFRPHKGGKLAFIYCSCLLNFSHLISRHGIA